MSRAGRWKSEAQSNAEALAQRGRTYADPNAQSFRFAWDANRRGPRDLRHAVELVRRAYRDEVPTKLHEQGLADDGTPAMTAKAEAYIFGSPTWTDAGKGDAPLVSFYLTPFRATLSDMEKAREPHTRRRAKIVSHVAFGMEPIQAATTEGAHPLDAKLVVFDALSSFLRRLSDVRVDDHLANEHQAA